MTTTTHDMSTASPAIGLDPHDNARALVRLVQCPRCSTPLKQPLTLPCGETLCRACLPQLHLREHISYPDVANRQQGFRCPFPACQMEHSLADCSVDVTLSKVVGLVGDEIRQYRSMTTDTPLLVEEKYDTNEVDGSSSSSSSEKIPPSSPPTRSRVLHGGRLVATYTMADMGELAYDADVSYQVMGSSVDDYRALDVAVFEHLKESTRTELDCQVCYHLLLDPLTTSCGHTFCRQCLHRILDHSNLCPICRRSLTMTPSLQAESSNRRLTDWLRALFPDALATRAEAVAAEEMSAAVVGQLDTPIFVCALSFPAMPMFLHVFEPRYRLMMRRVVESGTRTFGMVMYNSTGAPQGDLGVTQFMEYGTLLYIANMQILPDGRSLIESVGVSRFRIKDWGMRDGYMVAHVSRVDDMPVVQEEAMEALETSQPPASPSDLLGQIDRLSTGSLLQIATEFIRKMRTQSAPWLQEHMLASYGDPPTDDPALFPFWFASLLPIAEMEKYQLLSITSVRRRLKVVVRWVKRIEAQRW
ncbi:MAG: 54S ribosomal protein L23, mitochondrial [Watsoniomyces obsoletus]|nr:MAG: 54S ribosomal protein L23, mitochondrial [Watsoniomyces obsoletus]